MSVRIKGKASKRMGLINGLYFLGAGTFFIVSNVHQYRLFGICLGVAFCLCAPGLVAAPHKDHLAATGKSWVYRVAAVPSWCALPLLLAVGAMLWLGVGTTVAAPQMIRHPLLYNNRVIHTTGNALVGNGKCTLLVPDGTGHRSDTKIWLSSGSKLCSKATTTHARVSVSGTFFVLRPKDHAATNYVLADATITTAGRGHVARGI